MTEAQRGQEPIILERKPSFVEHLVPREQGRVYARDYKGTGSAFVLMHGFPDNLHIYDDLIPYLAAGGRRVVTFDFLGFGASGLPVNAAASEGNGPPNIDDHDLHGSTIMVRPCRTGKYCARKHACAGQYISGRRKHGFQNRLHGRAPFFRLRYPKIKGWRSSAPD
jgi:pimeloyl-ACP methyl ester carboxylesterase